MVWLGEKGEVEAAMEARCAADPTYETPHQRGVHGIVSRPVLTISSLSSSRQRPGSLRTYRTAVLAHGLSFIRA